MGNKNGKIRIETEKRRLFFIAEPKIFIQDFKRNSGTKIEIEKSFKIEEFNENHLATIKLKKINEAEVGIVEMQPKLIIFLSRARNFHAVFVKNSGTAFFAIQKPNLPKKKKKLEKVH